MIEFEVEWDSTSDSAELARGAALMRIQGRTVWPPAGANSPSEGLSWRWIELLEHLAVVWPYLCFEEIAPFGPFEPNQNALARAINDHLTSVPDSKQDEHAMRAQRFLERHDLASGMHGIWLPVIYVFREGKKIALLASKQPPLLIEASICLADLRVIGETIAERLREASGERALLALKAWEEREQCDPETILRLQLLGPETPEKLTAWFQKHEESQHAQRSQSPTRDRPLLAVARMAGGALETDATIQVLDGISELPPASLWGDHQGHEKLTMLSEKLCKHTLTPTLLAKQPYEQGYALARAVRKELSIKQRAEPADLLESFGVLLQEAALPARIQAIGLWGDEEGPRIVRNTEGVLARSFNGWRATLAHELCHLLVDRDGAAPLADVMGGAAPLRIEKRANAFAAEFLLPRAEIRKALSASGYVDPDRDGYGAGSEEPAPIGPSETFDDAVRKVQDEFGVGRLLVLYQIKNDKQPGGVWRQLDALAQESIDDDLVRMQQGYIL